MLTMPKRLTQQLKRVYEKHREEHIDCLSILPTNVIGYNSLRNLLLKLGVAA